MVRIRLKRFGKKRQPSYRVVVMNVRSNRDGKAIDEVGFYHPLVSQEDKQIKLNDERIKFWLDNGAQPSDTVKKLINRAKIYN